MEGFDTKMAARVWKRVRGTEQPASAEGTDILDMLFQSHGLAGLYLGLQRRMTGEANTRTRELYRQHRDVTACLKGMLLVSGGTVPGLPPMVPGSGSLRSVLEGCFHRERRLRDALACWSGDEDLSMVCQMQADQSVQRMSAVLELLGDVK